MTSPVNRQTRFVVLTCIFDRDGKWVTAECQELGTTAFGRNLNEAEKRLREAILLHLNTLEEVGERARFYREHKIKLYTRHPETVRPTIPTDVLSKAEVVTMDRDFAFA